MKKKRNTPQHALLEPLGEERFDALIEPYLDGALSAAEVRRFEAHLEASATAAAQLALARRIRASLRALPGEACPPQVWAAVAARTAAADRRWRLPAWLAPHRLWQPALALALLAVVAIGLWEQQTPPPQPPAITAEEVRRAEADVKLALAYLGEIGRSTGEAVEQDALASRVMAPVARSLAGVFHPGQPDA